MTIETLLFDLDESVDVSTFFFKSLGLPFGQKGGSLNSLRGEYSDISVFGINIKLEANTYDYEDNYKYMVSVYKDRLTELTVDQELVTLAAKMVARLLADNLKVNVAHEVNGDLEVYKPFE